MRAPGVASAGHSIVDTFCYRDFSAAALPVRHLRVSGGLYHTAASAQTAAAPQQRASRQPRHCCQAAAVPTGFNSAAEPDPEQPQQQSPAALWLDEDIYDAFDVLEASSTGAVVGGQQQLPDFTPQALQAQQQAQKQQKATGAASKHSRHQRRFHQQLTGAAHHQQQQRQQQQHSGLQQLQPVVRSFQHAHLLQRIAGLSSWTAAAAVLQEQHSMQAEHIALLWSCLTPKLQAQQQAAARRAAALHGRQQQAGLQSAALHPDVRQQLQVQQAVVQQLCALTGQFACSMGPQALVATLQGLAAAAAAGRVSFSSAEAAGPVTHMVASGNTAAAAEACGCVALDRQLQQLLQEQVLQVAASCSPQQLATCLASCQQLGWCCHTNTNTNTSSSSSSSSQWLCQHCGIVLQEGSKGQLGAQLAAGSVSSITAARLVNSLAGCVAGQSPQSMGTIQQQQQDQAQEQPLMLLLDASAAAAASFTVGSDLLPQLADLACHVLAQNAGASGETAGFSTNSNGSGGACMSDALLAAAVCSLQAFALLQHMPDPSALEQLLADLQPYVAAGRLDPPQLLSLLLSCQQLGVEPWPEWLQDCYSALSSSGGLQGLGSGQVLQLLSVLGGITNLQPSRLLLHQLAKMTAVHCSRYSMQQLASLPAGLQALGFRPEPYWLKDFYLATSRALLAPQQQQQGLRPRAGRQKQRKPAARQQQQQQQQQGPGASAAVLAEMLSGVGWLDAAAPPEPWLQSVEAALLDAAAWEASCQQQQQQQQHQETAMHSQQNASASSGQGGALQGAACVLPARMSGQFGVVDRPQLWLPPACAAVVARVLGQWGHTPCSQLQEVLTASLQDQHTSGPGGGGGAEGDAEAPAQAITAAVDAGQLSRGLSGSGGSSRGSGSGSSSSSSWHGAEPMPGEVVVSAMVGRSPAYVQQPPAMRSSDSTFSFDSDEQLGWLQGLDVSSAATPTDAVQGESMAHQLAELSLAGRLGRGRPLAKSWYRSKLLQLVKASRQKQPALVL